MIAVQYTCRICRGPGTAEAPEDLYDADSHGKWVAMLCHDSCYDAWSAAEKHAGRVCNLAVLLVTAESAAEKERADVAGVVRPKLIAATKSWASAKCRMLRVPSVWDEEIVNAIMEHPKSWRQVLQNAVGMFRSA